MSNKGGGAIAALAGLVIGAVALGSRKARAVTPPPPPPPPRDPTSMVNFDNLPASRRQWRVVYTGSAPPVDLQPAPAFAVGTAVRYQVPSTERDTPPDPLLAGKTLKITKVTGSQLWYQGDDQAWRPVPGRGINWLYTTNVTAPGANEPIAVDQRWLVSAQPEPTLVAKVAEAIIPPAEYPAAGEAKRGPTAPAWELGATIALDFNLLTPNLARGIGQFRVVGYRWDGSEYRYSLRKIPQAGDAQGLDYTKLYGFMETKLKQAFATSPSSPAAPPAPVTQQQEAAMQLPLYPQGVVFSKGSISGGVTAISKDAQGYHYQIKAGWGPITETFQGTEAEVRDKLAAKMGQQSYGYAFPEGLTLTAKGQSWTIQKRVNRDGKRLYLTNRGEIEEPQLILQLYQALKA